jgi:hypothetical protein
VSGLDLFTLAVAGILLALAAGITLYARSAPMADSPWFWLFVFSTSATVALFVMGNKYGHRQGHIEDEYRYGTRSLQKPGSIAQSTATQTKAPTAAGRAQTTDSVATLEPVGTGLQPPTHDLLISLVPLRFLAVGAMIVSWIALQWRRLRTARNSSAAAG